MISATWIWAGVTLGICLLAYVLGSFPTGYLMAKGLRGIDIREHGSGSTGATNVLRVLGKGPGLTVFLANVAKGSGAIAFVPVVYSWLATVFSRDLCQPGCQEWLQAQPMFLFWVTTLVGFSALLGHSKSLFLGFSGGKSVATSLGILLMMNWQVALATFGCFAVMLAISRIVSLSSITGAIALPVLMLLFHQPLAYLVFALAGSLYVVVRHTSNIQRLMAGTEPRLGEASKSSTV